MASRCSGCGAATPRVAQLAFLVVAAFLLVNKVYSPQYVLWLLPLAVLARPRWRDLLIWQAGELLYFGAVWLYLGGWLGGGRRRRPGLRPRDPGPGGGELYLVAVVVRDILRPEHDPVRDQRPSRIETSRCWATRRLAVRADSASDLDRVEGGGGEPDPDVDLVADLGHGRRPRAGTASRPACAAARRRARCLPPTVYGDRTSPAASRPPRASEAARAQRRVTGRRLQADAVGGAAGDDQDRAARAEPMRPR